MPDQLQYEVFLSHSVKDKPVLSVGRRMMASTRSFSKTQCRNLALP